MSRETGVSASLKDDGIELRSDAGSAEPTQSELFAELLNEQDAVADAQGIALPKRGPGRPAGARNRSTELTKRAIRAIGGDPQLAAARLVAGGPLAVVEMAKKAYADAYLPEGHEDFSGLLSTKDGLKPVLSMKDAISIWQRAGEFLGPYMMSKEALKVSMDVEGLQVTMQLGGYQTAEPDIVGGAQQQRSQGYSLPDQTKSDTYDADDAEVTREESHTGEASD